MLVPQNNQSKKADQTILPPHTLNCFRIRLAMSPGLPSMSHCTNSFYSRTNHLDNRDSPICSQLIHARSHTHKQLLVWSMQVRKRFGAAVARLVEVAAREVSWIMPSTFRAQSQKQSHAKLGRDYACASKAAHCPANETCCALYLDMIPLFLSRCPWWQGGQLKRCRAPSTFGATRSQRASGLANRC